jgi:hypothetical protein
MTCAPLQNRQKEKIQPRGLLKRLQETSSEEPADPVWKKVSFAPSPAPSPAEEGTTTIVPSTAKEGAITTAPLDTAAEKEGLEQLKLVRTGGFLYSPIASAAPSLGLVYNVPSPLLSYKLTMLPYAFRSHCSIVVVCVRCLALQVLATIAYCVPSL